MEPAKVRDSTQRAQRAQKMRGKPEEFPLFFVFSVHSVLLILNFAAPRVELSDLLGGPGFSPAEAKSLSVGFSR
jgi:hypothetical protein